MVLAHQERKARYRLDQCEASATQAGDGWKVSGDKSVVPAGDQADAFIVPATAGRGKIALFLVERQAQAGVPRAATPPWTARRAAEVSLRDAAAAALITQDGLPRWSTRWTSASPAPAPKPWA